MSVIYRIRVKGYDKAYIGSAKSFKHRKAHHRNRLRAQEHRNQYLQRLFNKYGEESLSFEILEECEVEKLIEREQAWIDKEGFDNLINLCPTAGNTLGRVHSEETRGKISENHADVSGKNNPQWGMRGEKSAAWGRKHSEEAKRKISEAGKGREPWCKGKKRPKHSERMSGENNHFYGKKHTEESRQMISERAQRSMREKGGKKLTLELVKEIRMRYNEEQITVTQLAKEYGLSRTYCGQLLKGKYWKE